MLLSITDKCRMECAHCMDDARPENSNYMDYDVFMDAVKFTLKYDYVLIITGGEPTEHPMFWDFMSYVAGYCKYKDCMVIIATNGMNIDEEPIGKIYESITNLFNILGDKLVFQVSADPRYYKKGINLKSKVFELPRVMVEYNVHSIYPQGRALKNGMAYDSKASKCFNIRSLIHNSNMSLRDGINMLRIGGKFCTPQISYNGMLKLGESTLCPAVASIYDSEDVIIDKISKFRCNGCNIINDKLPRNYRVAIGEEV